MSDIDTDVVEQDPTTPDNPRQATLSVGKMLELAQGLAAHAIDKKLPEDTAVTVRMSIDGTSMAVIIPGGVDPKTKKRLPDFTAGTSEPKPEKGDDGSDKLARMELDKPTGKGLLPFDRKRRGQDAEE